MFCSYKDLLQLQPNKLTYVASTALGVGMNYSYAIDAYFKFVFSVKLTFWLYVGSKHFFAF